MYTHISHTKATNYWPTFLGELTIPKERLAGLDDTSLVPELEDTLKIARGTVFESMLSRSIQSFKNPESLKISLQQHFINYADVDQALIHPYPVLN